MDPNQQLFESILGQKASFASQLVKHFALLREWNQRIGLVSRKGIDSAPAYHYADSIHISLLSLPYIGELNVKDLGSGAGFPGLVFAILFPEVRIELFESIGKKRSFLEASVEHLGLKNVKVSARLELGKRMRAFFFARAVHPPLELLPWMSDILTPGSRFALNIGAAPVPGTKEFKTLLQEKYDLPSDAGSRTLVLLEKL